LRALRGETAPPAFDGYSEAWFEDGAALAAALTSDGWKNLAADGPNLFERKATVSARVEERLLRPR
jgi:hypothetical protein